MVQKYADHDSYKKLIYRIEFVCYSGGTNYHFIICFLFSAFFQAYTHIMGNGQSQTKDKTKHLLSSWTPAEQEGIQTRFENLKDTTQLPVYFSSDLYTCFVTHLQQQDKVHYLEFVNKVLKTKDIQTIYTVFQTAVKSKQVSLEEFVKWVVTTAIPIWFESGSGYTWTDHGLPDLLVDYLITHASEQAQQQKKSMAWLELDQEDNQDQHLQSDNHTCWKSKATQSPSQLTEPEFVHWIQGTPAFIHLFQVLTRFALVGEISDLHKSRVSRRSSPRIQKHNKETRRLFNNKFSSMLHAFDYYLLTLYLPANALSWTDYEKSQRRVTEDLQHTLVFSSRRDGMSWQNFANRLIAAEGATLTVIKTKDGSLFGGYADDAYEYGKTDWYGNSSNFLFRLWKSYGAWSGTNGNNHYQYLCWGKKSLPNGFGMGGQFNYAGLWVDADFIHGHSRAGPLCTTFNSPQLSKEETFLVDEVEGKK